MTTIQIPPAGMAFYQGVGAGDSALKSIREAGPAADSHELRSRLFWLTVGFEMAKANLHNLEDSEAAQSAFCAGAATRAPHTSQLPEGPVADAFAELTAVMDDDLTDTSRGIAQKRIGRRLGEAVIHDLASVVSFMLTTTGPNSVAHLLREVITECEESGVFEDTGKGESR